MSSNTRKRAASIDAVQMASAEIGHKPATDSRPPHATLACAYGSVGEVTFYHRNGKCYYRKRSHSRYPGTAAQTSALDVHRRALAAWREVPHQTQQVWNRLLVKIQLTAPGCCRHLGLLRNSLAEGDCSAGVVSIMIPGYVERWG